MKDVSKQTIEDLITFIYCGEVKVAQENVDDFLQTAAALKIKGLADGCYEQADDSRASTSTWSAAAYNRLQYQSSRTVQIPKSANHKVAHSSYNAFQNDFEHENSESFNENIEDMDTNINIGSYVNYMNNDDFSVNQKFKIGNDQWDTDSKNGFDETPTTATASKAKRSKRNVGKY